MNHVIEAPYVRTSKNRVSRSLAEPTAKVMRVRGPAGNIRVRKVKPLNILMIEDNPSDALLTRMAFEQCDIPGYISDEITDGNSALKLLHNSKTRSDGREPDVILLDLGLPERNGFEILAEINEDTKLNKIPIIILTGFGHFEYLKDTYKKSRIVTYLQKPCTSAHIQDALLTVISHKYNK